AVGILNYLPTRLAPIALLVGLGCGYEMLRLFNRGISNVQYDGMVFTAAWLIVAPWLADALFRWRPPPPSAVDRVCRTFPDSLGFVWAQRLREQFNRSAAHACWPVILRWQGLRIRPPNPVPEEATQAAMLATLRALLMRFRSAEEGPENGSFTMGVQ